MAWNQPGDKNSPWGRRPNGGSSLEETVKNWQRRLDSLFGRGAGGDSKSLALFVALLVIVVWLFSGVYQIESAERGIIQRFGKYVETRNPGMGWRWPWPIETLTRVNVKSVNSSEYKSRVLTADVNLVDLKLSVQYQFSDPIKVLFRVRDPESTLREVSESAIREVVGRAQLEQILVGLTRNQLTDRTKVLIQSVLDAYNSGIRVTTVNLTDVQVPEAVVPSQRDANKALADQERYIKEAQAYANGILPNAEGSAARQVQDAEAYKSQVVSIAEGEASRFSQLAAAYSRSPVVTRQRLYLDAIESVLARSHKIVIDSKGAGGNMLYLPLDKLLERIRTAPDADSAAAPRSSAAPDADSVTVEGSRGRGER
jgi:membrane protease subunit HflK